MYQILHYLNSNGKDIFQEWLGNLKDKRAAAKIAVRILRLEAGNFGDAKSLGKGLYELRISEGQGYRVYYTLRGEQIVLLLCGGDKRTQSKDIKCAHEYLEDYLERE